MTAKPNHQSRWNHRNYEPPEVRRLDFLILAMPGKEIVSVSLREGIDFLDDLNEDFGDYYILETAPSEGDS